VRGYLARRLLAVIPVLFGVSVLVFGFLRLIPGDPAVAMLGEHAAPEVVAQIRENLGLDKPILEQYLLYMRRALRGDLGSSISRGEPVTQQILSRFPATFELGVSAMLIAIAVGVPAGIISATRRNSLFDNISRIVSLTGVSMPIFWLGLMLAWFFGVMLGLFPTGGPLRTDVGFSYEPITGLVLLDSVLSGNGELLVDRLHHLALPAVALGTIPMAIIARMTRSSMLEVLGQDYIRTARAKGVRERVVVVHHALRNALLPIITVIGLQVGRLLSGAILTETIFSWPGIGLWTYQAIGSRDYPVVQGSTLFIAVIFVFTNLVVDLLYGVIDPRIKYE
jgi:peptide/nickel transport system permease protein